VPRDWTTSDVCFLEAVGDPLAEDDGDLAAVIFVGDHLSKAIFTREEIVEAVRRLTSAELIAIEDGRFRLTGAGASLRSRSPHREPLERMRWTKSVLRDEVEYDDTGQTWDLDPRAYALAIMHYGERFAAAYERVRQREH